LAQLLYKHRHPQGISVGLAGSGKMIKLFKQLLLHIL